MSDEIRETTAPQFVELNPSERRRTYWYEGGTTVELINVRRIAISSSGTHRLETGDGVKHIVAPGWLHIELDVDSWTF